MHECDNDLHENLVTYNLNYHASTILSIHILMTAKEKYMPLTCVYPLFVAGELSWDQTYATDLIERPQYLHEKTQEILHQTLIGRNRQLEERFERRIPTRQKFYVFL